MIISAAGVQLIKSFEGCHSSPYRCPANLWTVGYGRVLYPEQARLKTPERTAYKLKPVDNRAWSHDEIDDLLAKDLYRFTSGVLRLCPAAADNDCHLDALTSFSFNVGLGNLQASTLRMKYNRAEFINAADEFPKWRRAGGRIVKGLVRRRKQERELFLT